MTKEEIKEEIELIDADIVVAIIECCKQLYCDGIPLCNWDYDTALERFNKATEDWEDTM